MIYGSETWSVTLREEHILRVLTTGRCGEYLGVRGWRRLHNEELHNLYASPNIRVIKSRRMRWGGGTYHV